MSPLPSLRNAERIRGRNHSALYRLPKHRHHRQSARCASASLSGKGGRAVDSVRVRRRTAGGRNWSTWFWYLSRGFRGCAVKPAGLLWFGACGSSETKGCRHIEGEISGEENGDGGEENGDGVRFSKMDSVPVFFLRPRFFSPRFFLVRPARAGEQCFNSQPGHHLRCSFLRIAATPKPSISGRFCRK